MDAFTLDDVFDGRVSIPAEEYEALTHLESQVRRMAARRTPVDRGYLSALLERVRASRGIIVTR